LNLKAAIKNPRIREALAKGGFAKSAPKLPGVDSRSQKGWETIGGKRHFFRSSWEVTYAKHLQALKEAGAITDWEYEAETFWFEGIRRGVTNYKPDFRVRFPDGAHEYHEVKGWMDPKSATKLKRMAKYHPTEKVVVIDKEWFRRHRK
jgi:hypothetical protein